MEISWAFMTFREQSGKPGSGIHALEATRRDVGNENQTILRTKHMWQTIMSGFFFRAGLGSIDERILHDYNPGVIFPFTTDAITNRSRFPVRGGCPVLFFSLLLHTLPSPPAFRVSGRR